jgi:predicted amidohydrolase YtcJ
MAEIPKSRNILIHNARVYTQATEVTFCQAVAIINGKIAWLGMDDDLFKIPSDKFHIIDLKGMTVLPSFTDAHMHYAFWAWSLGQIDLKGCKTYQETLARIKSSVKDLKRGEWLLGQGWLRDAWKNPVWPHKRDLDKILPNNPAVMLARDQHAIWVNSKVLEIAGITPDTPNPEGGEISRDKSGSPTGILKDKAASFVYALLPPPGETRAMELFGKAEKLAHSLGITAVGSMDAIEGFKYIQNYHRRHGLKIRISHYLPVANLDNMIELGIKSGFGDDRLRIQGVKFFTDGALGSQTALMFKPYAGSKSNYGLAIYDQKELNFLIKKSLKAGLNVAIHAIGDRANFIALEAIIKAQGKNRKKYRNRIEHCQILRKEDIDKFGQNGIIASVQPCHLVLDIEMIHKYWGKRGRYAYPFESLLQSDAMLAFGSDAPIEPPNPIWNISCAVTRKNPSGTETFYPSEKILTEKAIYAHTFGGAWSVEQEHKFGSIKVGNFADIVIIDKDLHNLAPDQIKDVKIMGTLLEGEFVYGKERFNDW